MKTELRKEKLVIPKIIFSCDPIPNAFNIQSAGTIQVNFGLFLSLGMMFHTVAWVQHLLQIKSINYDAITDLVIPPEVIGEINHCMKWWRSFDRTHEANLAELVPSSFLNKAKWFEAISQYDIIYAVCEQMFTFIVFHEMAHWFRAVFLPNEWEKLTSETKKHLISWLSESENNFLSKERQDISLIFENDPKVFDYWAEEIQADVLSVDNCIGYFSYFLIVIFER